MTHRFPLKEIARQAGLGTATVDRALHGRAHVSPQTQARVTQAIKELTAQEMQLAARGRRMFFDVVIEAPSRFSRAVQKATEQVFAASNVAVCRPRFLCQEVMSEADIVSALLRIAKRGSQGVCLKVRDLPAVRKAINALGKAGIPVITLVTDVPETSRLAYVGLDNHSAGRTAAYLIAQMIGRDTGTVLATRSHDQFLGEEDRQTAFLAALSAACPQFDVVTVSGGRGRNYETLQVIQDAMRSVADLKAVYSMGGGNRSILGLLDESKLRPQVFVAHDLDHENRRLIEAGRLNFVLHHDLEADMAVVLQSFLHHHSLVQDPPVKKISNVQIITPANIPPRDPWA